MTEKRTYLRKKVQIWWVKNDTAAQIGNLKMTLACIYDRKKHIFALKKCRFGGSKMTQQHIAILLQRPVYCFWRADFHGQGATHVTPDNLMYSLPTILPCSLYRLLRAI
jgi:hypothetical protein